MAPTHRFLRAPSAALACALIGLAISGCQLWGLREQHALDRRVMEVTGRVELTGELEGNLVVVLIRSPKEGGENELLDHYVVARNGGRFRFFVTEPGRYAVAAFNDRDRNFVYEPEEPVLVSGPATIFELELGETRRMDVIVDADARADPKDPIDVLEFESRNRHEQLQISMRQIQSVGEVAELSDPRFAAEVGPKGLWTPYSFIFEVGAGIFFLEPYDPRRIPVLFVHGISGFPAQFGELIDAMDRKRFQPWIYLYPSGAKLHNVARHLSQLVVELESRHGLKDMVFVAHSMGGLVTRAFLLDYESATSRHYERSLLTISTPWGGIASAALGAERMRNPVYSWIDVAPNSPFLDELFYQKPETRTRRHLPPGIASHLLFGFENKGGALGTIAKLLGSGFAPAQASDGTATVASQLRDEAQQDAQTLWGVNATHVGILKDPSTIDRFNALLGRYADER